MLTWLVILVHGKKFAFHNYEGELIVRMYQRDCKHAGDSRDTAGLQLSPTSGFLPASINFNLRLSLSSLSARSWGVSLTGGGKVCSCRASWWRCCSSCWWRWSSCWPSRLSRLCLSRSWWDSPSLLRSISLSRRSSGFRSADDIFKWGKRNRQRG